MVQRLLGEKVPGSFTTMHLAAFAGLPGLLSKLMESGHVSEIHFRDSLDNQPLVWAAINGHFEAVQLLPACGAQVGATNKKELKEATLLVDAALSRASKAKTDAEIQEVQRINEGVTALYWGAKHGHASIIQLLLDKGAKCRPKDKIGWTPPHRAAFNGHTGVARVLLDNDADIEAKDGTKWTTLMRAAITGNMEVI